LLPIIEPGTSTQRFLDNPSAAATQIWINTGKNVAANGAVMRTCILGIPYFYGM
jgi:hypothetical protein